MEIINLSKKDSILNHFIREIRDVDVQQDSMRFRKNLQRIGEIFAYEISQRFKYSIEDIKTPLGLSKEKNMNDELILATILRAGIPFHLPEPVSVFRGSGNRAEKAGLPPFPGVWKHHDARATRRLRYSKLSVLLNR